MAFDLEAFVGIWLGRVKARRRPSGCHRPRKRVIQYSENSELYYEGRGVLDAPFSRGMTAEVVVHCFRGDDTKHGLRWPAQRLQKSRQIIRDMIDVGMVAAFQLPILAHDFL
jgi:hypothetical protein